MKFNLPLLGVFLSFAVLTTACKDEMDHALKLSGTACAFGSGAGSTEIAVGTNLVNWTAGSSDTGWLTATPAGDYLKIDVTSNEGTLRSGVITIYAGEASATINVVQEGAQEGVQGTATIRITPEPEDETIRLLAGPYRSSFTVHSDHDWSVEGDDDWYTIDTDYRSGVVTINYGLNEGAARTGEIRIIAGSGEEKYTRTFSLAQIAMAADPYYSLMGDWEMYCSQWVLETQEQGGGVHDVSTFVPGEPYETITIKGMFFDQTSMLVYYDRHTDKISIPVGWPVHETESSYVYLLQFKTITKGLGRMDHFYETLTGEISGGRDRIELTGFHEQTFYLLNNGAVVDEETLAGIDPGNPDYQVEEEIPTVYGMGLMGVNKLTTELSYYRNVYYANTGDVVLTKVAGSGSSAPVPYAYRAAGQTPPTGFVKYGNGYMSAGILK